MSRSRPQRQKWNKRAAHNSNGESLSYSRGFAVYRKLDEDQAHAIRAGLDDIFRAIPGARVRGYGEEHDAGLMVIGKY